MPESIVASNGVTPMTDLRELVGRTVEEMPDVLLEKEAGDLVVAERCERKTATASGEVLRGRRCRPRPSPIPVRRRLPLPRRGATGSSSASPTSTSTAST